MIPLKLGKIKVNICYGTPGSRRTCYKCETVGSFAALAKIVYFRIDISSTGHLQFRQPSLYLITTIFRP